MESLEPRLVLDGTPGNPAHPVVELQTNFGNIYIELFSDVAPANVANFLGYVTRGDYDNTFIHRHALKTDTNGAPVDFVLQAGGWTYDEDNQNVDHITEQNPVVNEFGLSNLQWTVATAKLGGDPDSGTSEWFVNLDDNAHSVVDGVDSGLDVQNGGFTVFGEVVGGREVVNAITDLRIINLGGDVFKSIPMTDTYDPSRSEVFDSDLVWILDASLVYDPDSSLLLNTTTLPGGTANGSNLTTVTITSQFDRAIAFQQNSLLGGWTVTDLSLKAEQSGNTSNPVTWIDPKDGKTYAAAISSDGLILYKNTTGTTWTARNLNDELTGAGLITSSLTTFVTQGDKAYVAGLNADGEMLLFRQTGASANGEFVWTADNLSQTDLLVNNLDTTPTFTSPLTSYVTSWNGLNIVGLDANGDIQAVWWAPGRPGWSVTNLSDSTGAPPLVGTVAPYLTTWYAINLTGIDAAGNVVVTWWIPSFGADWVQTNLTELKSGPTLAAGSIATYVTPWGGTNILGRDADGDLIAYWWAPSLGAGQWQITNLSDLITGAESTTGPTIGFSSPSGVVNIFGAAADGELIRYWWRPGSEWQWENVSSTAELT